jgi:hypothetical protein
MVNVRGLPYVILDSMPPTGEEKGGELRRARQEVVGKKKGFSG